MLERVYALREEIPQFLESKNVAASEFHDPKGCLRLAFFVDLTSHLNNLNLQLLGKNLLIHEMCESIFPFQRK